MSEEPISSRARGARRLWWLALLLPAMLIVHMLVLGALRPRYPFLHTGHLIDVVSDASGHWYYYLPEWPEGSVDQLAAEVKADLLARGFVEDKSQKPWYRFVKGDREVVVCYHCEIATIPSATGQQVVHGTWPPSLGAPPRNAVIWCREPGDGRNEAFLFQIEKKLLGY